MLEWNGEFIGTFTSVDIINKWKYNNETYIHLKGNIYGILYKSIDLLSCIIDELKPLFNLKRRGLVRLILNHSRYILYKVDLDDWGQIIYEVPLHKLSNPEHFRDLIQRILIFCEILGLNKTTEANIRIRKLPNDYVIFNTNDKKTALNRDTIYDFSILTPIIWKKWLGEKIEINKILMEMLKIEGEINAFISDFRNKVQEIIKKYDSEYIWYENFLINRLMRNLQN